MPSASGVIFAAWSPPIVPTGTLVVLGLVYVRGWLAIRKTRPDQFPPWRLGSFLLGLCVIWFAIASPLDGFADVLCPAAFASRASRGSASAWSPPCRNDSSSRAFNPYQVASTSGLHPDYAFGGVVRN